MVEGIVERLRTHNMLENTYIFYTSDNGYHISQHRLHPGKECGFEEDINIPLIIRGPGVGSSKVLNTVTSHTDLAPTIMEIAAGARGLDHEFDGSPIPLNDLSRDKREHVNVEYWGRALPEGAYGLKQSEIDVQGGIPYAYLNNTYKALRIIGDDYNLYYSVWCTNEMELYNLMVRLLFKLGLSELIRWADVITRMILISYKTLPHLPRCQCHYMNQT
jgi:N-acetylglucosamine-6-sulfatase